MPGFDYSQLVAACSPGGASVITSVTELAPAAGPHAGVAPPRYVSGRNASYAFETRNIDGEALQAVVLDGKASQLNRVEAALGRAIEEGDEVLSRMPRMTVSYESGTFADYEVPHRAFDGHFRAGTIDGKNVTDDPTYIAARNATPANVLPLVQLSPVSPTFGAWDSTRKANQARYRSSLVGDIMGVLVDQGPTGTQIPNRGGGRSDSIAPSVRVPAKEMQELLDAQRHELSEGTIKSIETAIKGAKGGKISASGLVIGSIPPNLGTPGLVSCTRIIRSHVLSLSALRQLRFGSPGQGDVAGRALLAALALYALALANEELVLRANCDLVEKERPDFILDGRFGVRESIGQIDREVGQRLLAEAIEGAEKALGIKWEGQVYAVTGNPLIARGAESEEEA